MTYKDLPNMSYLIEVEEINKKFIKWLIKKKRKDKAKKRVVVVEPVGQVHVSSTFNNIIISITNSSGQVISTPNNPYALSFDPTYMYAPNQGIRGFLGVRVRFK